MFMNMAMSWVTNHQDFLLGLASGWAVVHIPLLTRLAFRQAMKIEPLRRFVVANAQTIIEGLDEIHQEIDSDIEAEVAKDKAAQKPPAPPAVPPAVGLLLLGLLAFAVPCKADDSLLSLPGLADAAGKYAKEARPLGFMDLHGTYGGGVLLPLRALKDSAGIKYAAAGIGGTIKQGEHFRPRLAVVSDASALYRRLEKRWGWWDAHTEKITLPDFWFGPSLELPIPGDPVTWKDFGNATTVAKYINVAVSLGF